MLSAAIIDIASVFVRWIPIRAMTLDTTHHGIRWTLGKPKRVLTEPGMYWYIPWIQKITMQSILADVTESPCQLVGLGDGDTLSISVAVHYKIVDILKWYHAAEDFDASFVNLLQMAITDCVATMTFKGWLEHDVMFDLRKKFRTLARRWGVRVIDINFVNSGQSCPIHITGIELGGSDE